MELFRDQRIVTVGTADTVIAPGNNNRHALMIDCPPKQSIEGSFVSSVGHNVDCSAVASVLTIATQGTGKWRLMSATAVLTAGAAPTLSLRPILGGNNISVLAGVPPLYLGSPVLIEATAGANWHVDVGGVGATCDLTMVVQQLLDDTIVTLSFNGRTTASKGIKLYTGGNPVILIADVFGPAIREEIHAIATVDGIQLCVVDIFCPCGGVADKKMRGGYK